MREKVAVHFEEHFPTLNKWFEVNAYPSRDGLSVYFQDITERKQKETELKISSERYQFVAIQQVVYPEYVSIFYAST